MQNIKQTRKSKVAIIGGGVSGVAAALTLGETFQIDIYEREARLLKKLLKTGNGKANIFNRFIKPDSYNNPAFISLHPRMLEVVEGFYFEKGILTYVDEEGRGYPYSRSAKALANALLSKLGKNVRVFLETPITEIKKEQDSYTINGQNYDVVILTTGSSCYNPKLGVDNQNTSLFSSLGLKLNPLRPTSGPIAIEENLRDIENERVYALLSVKSKGEEVTKELGEIMFKRDALSGIASFIVHSRLTWDKGDSKKRYVAHLNLLMDKEDEVRELLKNRRMDESVLDGLFSDNLNRYLINRLPKRFVLDDVIGLLKNLTFKIKEDFTLTHDKGQIMNGGVDVIQINTHTFELISYHSLFLGGEVLDIDGISGGYNLMFALYSGVVIGKSIIDRKR